MESITLMRIDFLMCILVLPLLIICTGLLLGIVMFWKKDLVIKLLYRPVTDLKKCTHVIVKGVQGNTEICKLNDFSHEIAPFMKELT